MSFRRGCGSGCEPGAPRSAVHLGWLGDAASVRTGCRSGPREARDEAGGRGELTPVWRLEAPRNGWVAPAGTTQLHLQRRCCPLFLPARTECQAGGGVGIAEDGSAGRRPRRGKHGKNVEQGLNEVRQLGWRSATMRGRPTRKEVMKLLPPVYGRPESGRESDWR